MGERFERGRIEKCIDGGVMIGMELIPTIGESTEEDPKLQKVIEWVKCSEQHGVKGDPSKKVSPRSYQERVEHWWDVCPVKALFNTKGADGLTPKERMIAALKKQRDDQEAIAKGLKVPTRREKRFRLKSNTVDGQHFQYEEVYWVDVPITPGPAAAAPVPPAPVVTEI